MVNIKLSWDALKGIVTSKNLQMQYVDYIYVYFIFAVEPDVLYLYNMMKMSPASTEQTDFETNFKNNCNKNIVVKSDIVSQVQPAGTYPVSVSETAIVTKNGGIVNITYIITSGRKLVIQNFSGGGATPQGIVQLYYDPNGTGVGMTLLSTAYVNVSNFQFTLNLEFEGDTTRTIRLIMTNNNSTSNHSMTQTFSGYEEDIV